MVEDVRKTCQEREKLPTLAVDSEEVKSGVLADESMKFD